MEYQRSRGLSFSFPTARLQCYFLSPKNNLRVFMWILTAPFDEAPDNDANFQKTKLLKTGKAYELGRKDQPLIIKHPKISKSHAEFHVASCTKDDLLNPLFKPALRYVNKRDKPAKIDRGRTHFLVDPHTEEELHDGDAVWPIVSEKILVKWEALCCYYPPDGNKVASIVQGCISLGINLVHTPQSEVTHHLISTYSASASTALSLISVSQFVRFEWLEEIVRLGSPTGEDKPGASELEKSFALPPLSKYRPSFSPALQTSQKVYRVWEPNEERINLLKDYRIFLVTEIVNAIGSDMRDLIQRGGGSYECLDIHAGKSKWHKALVRGSSKEGQKLVLVGHRESLQPAINENEWQDLLHEVEIFNLAFVSPEVVVQAIINVDTSVLDAPSASGTVTQGSHTSSLEINRESQQRAASRQASVEPMESIQGPLSGHGIPAPRRALTRRARALQDFSDMTNTLPALPTTEPDVVPIDFSAPLPLRSARLKRRREASEPVESSDTLRTSLGNATQSSKKHKPLFEQGKLQDMDVEKMYSQLPVSLTTEASVAPSQTQSQSAASEPVQSPAFPTLSVVQEEEEEEETQTTGHNCKGLKRKAEMVSDETVPSMKRKRLETNKAMEEQAQVAILESGTSPSSTIQTSTNKPDIDAAFLQAVSSTKRGKRKEDDFDRDFNNLKIARPGLEHQEEEWDVVDDFGNETGIRGNFMLILEMDVPSKGNRTQRGPCQTRSEWQELPNFKRFKKKNNMRSGTKVELVVSEENDYGLGPSYWKSSHAQEHGSQASATQATQIKTETQARNNEKGRNQALIINDSDEEFNEVQPVVEPTLRAGRARAKTRNAAQPLFIESDNEKPKDLEGSQEASKAQAKTRSKKKAAVIVDDDSDDGAVFRGFKGKKRRS
ncbi:hypothetical protein APHAL10511_003119 [Amanita phalloides]|nr:hypothetical protein APHAL10511_003119 [Amanita phalloides]